MDKCGHGLELKNCLFDDCRADYFDLQRTQIHETDERIKNEHELYLSAHRDNLKGIELLAAANERVRKMEIERKWQQDHHVELCPFAEKLEASEQKLGDFNMAIEDLEKKVAAQEASCMKHEGHEHCITPCDSIRIQQENHNAYLLLQEKCAALTAALEKIKDMPCECGINWNCPCMIACEALQSARAQEKI